MKLLITGATGFVGRNLLLRVLQENTFSTIILPVRSKEKFLAQLSEEGISKLPEHLHLCSVKNNVWDLEGAPSPDLVIHCAGLTFSRERNAYFSTNVEGTLNLFHALPEKCRLLVLSSQSAAGPSSKHLPTRSSHDLEQPISWYGESKLAMEKKLLSLAKERLLILRPPMILGPRDSAIVPLFKMAKGLVRLKPGLQKKEYSWIAVDDLCEALLVAAKNEWATLPHHTYFLANPKTITDLELLATTASVLNARGISLRMPHAIIRFISIALDCIPQLREAVPSLGRDRVKEILKQRWVIDVTAFERDFKWKAQSSLRETLERTAAWLS